MDIYNESCSSGQPTIACKPFNHFFFICAMLIHTFDFYHYILSLTLTLA